ncbi:cholecystokinin receptor type A-like [Mercenaria mercenaria]|uniref:cholecystokinin receptor type A-like n=1 Tax=Mercenaria mercenaria TaxID=6596 RepID=UPI00234F18AB|nr:cholecystokinin receptor type A-like [Mercenaria mercenaria]
MENGSEYALTLENNTFEGLNITNGSYGKFRKRHLTEFPTELSITLYSIIFVLSITGNILVILTIIRDKKMRTITNLFLLNLAASDMMLSVLCMPFSLVATTLLRNFIFGEAMCIIIRYFQAVSVGVSCYTLVAISLERYYAICQPLRSRRWQTLSHARRMIIGIWIAVLALMSPIAAFHSVIEIRTGVHACREIWPDTLVEYKMELAYNVALSIFLLLIPLLMMGLFYGLVSKKLWISTNQCNYSPTIENPKATTEYTSPRCKSRKDKFGIRTCSVVSKRPSLQPHILTNRKRVIRMLVVIVLQYFICWTPIYLLTTWNAFDFKSVLRHISPMAKSLMLLLAYTSSFIHPITYGFMNRNFRQGFKSQFQCTSRKSPTTNSFRSNENGRNLVHSTA